MSTKIILSGLPGDMATRVKDLILKSDDFELAKLDIATVALTGEEHKGRAIDPDFISEYEIENSVLLLNPRLHEVELSKMREVYEFDNLIGINFANAQGYKINQLFVDYDIPFISGVTGAKPDQESKLVEAVQNSNISAVIDKNMSPALTVFGAMLEYAAKTFPEALRGFTGFGIDEHQASKADGISGTLLKWQDFYTELGIDFDAAQGSRKGDYGHAYHFMRLSSPDGKVNLNLSTDVQGRDTYAQGTVEKALPFLIKHASEKGKVYSMADTLRGDSD